MDPKDQEEALNHFCVLEGGKLARCQKCNSFLFAPFLKLKFGEISPDGHYECIVCIRRELIELKNKLS